MIFICFENCMTYRKLLLLKAQKGSKLTYIKSFQKLSIFQIHMLKSAAILPLVAYFHVLIALVCINDQYCSVNLSLQHTAVT